MILLNLIVYAMTSLPLFAATPNKGYKIETEFSYSQNGHTTHSKSEFILAKETKTWTTLTKPKDGVVLLARIVSQKEPSIGLEYIVVDTKQENAVVSTPMILATLGERSEISVGMTDTNSEVKIGLKAESTEYLPQ